MIGSKLFGGFQAVDRTNCISLLQEGSPQLEVSQFIAGDGLHDLAQQGHGLLQLVLQEQRVAKVVHRVGIRRENLKLSEKFASRRLELLLLQVDKTRVIVSFGKPGIELQGFANLAERAWIIFLLRIGLAEQEVDRWIARILLQQTAENHSSNLGLTHSDQSRAPREQ